MRISDWSSDVCSSDLRAGIPVATLGSQGCPVGDVGYRSRDSGCRGRSPDLRALEHEWTPPGNVALQQSRGYAASHKYRQSLPDTPQEPTLYRSEESRVGNECVSTCRSRGSPEN